MRISTAYQYSSYSTNVSNASQSLFGLQQQLSTGKRINQPSDDPYGTSISLSLTTLQSGLSQYNSNLSYAKSFLSTTEVALNDTFNVVQQAYQLAIRGASTATSQDGRNAMVSQVNELEATLLNVANSKGSSGEFLFSGQKTQVTPFSVSGNTLAYAGDETNLTVETGPVTQTVISIQGNPFFPDLYSQLESLKSNLQSGNVGALSSVDVGNLQASQDNVNQIRGVIGAKIQSVTDLTGQNSRRSDELTKEISGFQDADFAKVTEQYASAQTSYQAALTVASQGFKMSLMDFIH